MGLLVPCIECGEHISSNEVRNSKCIECHSRELVVYDLASLQKLFKKRERYISKGLSTQKLDEQGRRTYSRVFIKILRQYQGNFEKAQELTNKLANENDQSIALGSTKILKPSDLNLIQVGQNE